MTYRLSYANPDYESYTDLDNPEAILEALAIESEKVISDLGSDGYEPSGYLPENFEEMDEDAKYEAWQQATDKAIADQSAILQRRAYTALSSAFQFGSASFRMPDGHLVVLSQEN